VARARRPRAGLLAGGARIVLPLAASRIIDARAVARRRVSGSRSWCWDIVSPTPSCPSSWAAARLPAFVVVPLDTQHPQAVALLANIVTMTPGTVTAAIDDARTSMLVHVLHTEDPARVVADIKSRYERPLKEIFGC
jgi:hypothetical protein